jgi:hypothetical protein
LPPRHLRIGAGAMNVQMKTLAPFIASFFADFVSVWVFKNNAKLFLQVMNSPGDMHGIKAIAENINRNLEDSIRSGFAETMNKTRTVLNGFM